MKTLYLQLLDDIELIKKDMNASATGHSMFDNAIYLGLQTSIHQIECRMIEHDIKSFKEAGYF